jgi:hypothetical protein
MKKTVSQKLLHVELGCMPASFTWVKMACGFWNRLVTQRSSMLHNAFAENLAMSINGGKGRMWCPEQGVKLLGLLLTGSTGQHMAGRNGLA